MITSVDIILYISQTAFLRLLNSNVIVIHYRLEFVLIYNLYVFDYI